MDACNMRGGGGQLVGPAQWNPLSARSAGRRREPTSGRAGMGVAPSHWPSSTTYWTAWQS
eukprot:13590713-Alexandrium_andersonii.AAC.1